MAMNSSLLSKAMPFLKWPRMIKFGPAGVGLATIPLIVHEIDEGIDFLMDLTFRKWFPK